MATYIHTRKDWPKFQWDADEILTVLPQIRNKQGILAGKMNGLGFVLQNEAYMETLSQDIIKSSEIEGKILDRHQVRSSIARKLGVEIGGLIDSNRDVDGIVEIMLDATQNWESEVTSERLFGWHAALFPTGRSGMYKIIVGNWRDDSTGPMQVVSGAMGREKIHFIAPKARIVADEMNQFFKWINKKQKSDLVIQAALAHLWFITIHPFEDGNGRIARAISDMMLCRSEKQAQRFYSMSTEIEKQKSGYYDILESTQKGTLDVTEWILWFLNCLEKSIDASEDTVLKIMNKHIFWNQHKSVTFNERQIKILELLFSNFFGNLTTKKWAKINKCSHDTALRDIQDLVKKDILKKSSEGGRSTNYELIY